MAWCAVLRAAPLACMQVYGAVWNNFMKDRSEEGLPIVLPRMFVTYGVKHLKFWTQEFDEVRGVVIGWS